MNKDIIAVTSRDVAGEKTDVVDARELHAKLGVASNFRDWIKATLDDVGAEEKNGFWVTLEKKRNLSGGRPAIDYTLTVETAKHICMMSRSVAGRTIRDYFIECEKRLRQVVAPAYVPPVIRLLIQAEANKWELVWPREVIAALTGLHRDFTGLLRQVLAIGDPNPQCLSDDYQFIYREVLSPTVYDDLRAAWASGGSQGNQHQFLTADARKVVQAHMPVVEAIASQSRDVPDFRHRLRAFYRRTPLQLGMAS